MRVLGIINTARVISLLFTAGSRASGSDLHWLWDNRCAESLGHSSEFARKFLDLKNGGLQGRRHGEGLLGFMRNHYATGIEIDAVHEMLLAQVLTKPRFKQECSNCHGSAACFIRYSVILQDAALPGKKSGQPIRQFLQQHRRPGSDDVEFYTRLLNRVAREVYRP